MASGQHDVPTEEAYEAIWNDFYTVGVPDEGPPASFYDSAVGRLNELGEARRLRLLSSQSTIPRPCRLGRRLRALPHLRAPAPVLRGHRDRSGGVPEPARGLAGKARAMIAHAVRGHGLPRTSVRSAVMAGSLVGVARVGVTTSIAVLVFAGPLAADLPAAIGLTLVSEVVALTVNLGQPGEDYVGVTG